MFLDFYLTFKHKIKDNKVTKKCEVVETEYNTYKAKIQTPLTKLKSLSEQAEPVKDYLIPFWMRRNYFERKGRFYACQERTSK